MPEQLQSLLDRMPAPVPNERGILSKIDRDATLGAIAELHSAGPSAVTAVVDLLVEPGKGNDHKARYALHGLALYVCGLGGRERNDNDRKTFAESLAKTLDSDRPPAVKEFILRELQVCGGREVIEAIGKCLAHEALVDAAAAALVAIGGPQSIAELRSALRATNTHQRLVAIQNLGVLRDKESVKQLAEAARDTGADIRVAACWALANIGDPAGIDACLAAAKSAKDYERIQAGKMRLLLAQRLREAGHKAEAHRVLDHLRETSTNDAEAYLRQIAERELATVG